VKKGQVLFEIDPRTFQAALEQAKGSWKPSRHAGQQPRRIWPGLNPSRAEAVSKKDLDDAIGTEHSARAAVTLGTG